MIIVANGSYNQGITGDGIMLLTSGKYEGKSSEEVVLKYGSYVQWYLDAYPDSKNGKEFRRLISIFDGKPFASKCYRCNRTATRASIYRDNYDFMFWCDSCNPYDSGARAGTLNVIRKYSEALENIDLYAEGRQKFKNATIRALAEGKGLPKRVGASQAENFFTI